MVKYNASTERLDSDYNKQSSNANIIGTKNLLFGSVIKLLYAVLYHKPLLTDDNKLFGNWYLKKRCSTSKLT